jgi:hypothetical protein
MKLIHQCELVSVLLYIRDISAAGYLVKWVIRFHIDVHEPSKHYRNENTGDYRCKIHIIICY